MTTALAERPAYTGTLIAAEKLQALEEIAAAQVNVLAHPAKGAIFGPAFQRAEAIATMRRMLTNEVMQPIMALQGSRLGFRTDRDKERNKDGSFGYPIEVVRDCMIEGILLGARPSGNEINIIASNCYLTREFFTRILREWPGLTDLVIEQAPPANGPYGAMLDCKATWRIEGKPDSLICQKTDHGDSRIVVRVNAGMGADAIYGKADRKLKAKIWQKLTGSESSVDGDVDDPGFKPTASRTLELQPENGGKPNGSQPAPSSPAASRSATSFPQAPPQREPGDEVDDPYDPKVAIDLEAKVGRAVDRKELRRIYQVIQKETQSGRCSPLEHDRLLVVCQERKRELPDDASSN
jgi:hypothetical protein